MKTRNGQFEEINITPLTDVFLVLLVIMMLVAPLIDLKGLDLGLPELSTTSVNPDESKTLRVEITAAGEYRVDNQPVPKDGLSVAIKDGTVNKPDGVFLDPNPEADLEATAYAIAAINQAGVTDISLDNDVEDDASDAGNAEPAPTPAPADTAKEAPKEAPKGPAPEAKPAKKASPKPVKTVPPSAAPTRRTPAKKAS